MRLRRLYHTSTRLWARTYFDAFGKSAADTKLYSVIQSLNASVDLLVTSNADSASLLKQTLSEDGKCKMSHILMTFALLRQSEASNSESIQLLLNKLAAVGDKLDDREKLLCAASHHWFQGNYLRAGALLESYTAKNQLENDVLGMRLAQDCYSLAASNENVLGCVIRHSSGAKNAVDPGLVGLLSTGLVENKQFAAAEEAATQSMERSKGKSALVLHSLLNSSQLSGSNSVVISLVNRYVEHHKGSAEAMLQFNKGLAQIQRGQFTSAYRSANSMLIALEKEFPSEGAVEGVSLSAIPRGYLNLPVLLVWSAFINDNDSLHSSLLLDLIDVALTESRNQLRPSQDVLSDVTNSMLLALAEHLLSTHSRQSQEAAVPSGSEAATTTAVSSTERMWSHLRNLVNPGYSRANNPDALQQEAAARDRVDRGVTHLRGVIEGLKEQHETHLRDTSRAEKSSYDASVFAAVAPSVSIRHHYSENGTNGLTDLQVARQRCSLPLHFALLALGRGEPLEASKIFHRHREVWHYLGGAGAVARDIVAQTHIEVLMQSGELQMAKMLLQERNALVPFDSHSHRRLGAIFQAEGNTAAAEQAGYTAYQIGLGQGGLKAGEIPM